MSSDNAHVRAQTKMPAFLAGVAGGLRPGAQLGPGRTW